MKLQVVLAAFISLVFSSGAHAGERYLVVLKSAQSFRTANIAFSGQSSPGEFQGLEFKTKSRGFAKADLQVVDSLENLKTLVMRGDATEIAKLQGHAEVALIEKEVFHPAPKPVRGYVLPNKNKSSNMLFSASSLAAPPLPWGIEAVRAPYAWQVSGNKGVGTRVLVLDTGIEMNHPSLAVNLEKGQDFTGLSDGSDFSDVVGHGTHVAGTIAGVQEPTGFTGVAPEAKILMGRVCAEDGCSNVAIAQGINWGISENVDVISMSLGGKWSTPAERAAIASADQAGITVVAASGNDGSGVVSYPAALPTVIAVGAVNDQLERAPFSQFGPELDIVAPGVSVVSTVPMGSGREGEVHVTMRNMSQKVASATPQGARESFQAKETELVYVGLGKPSDFARVNVAGKYALISRGEISFLDKVRNAMAARASGVIIYNNAPGLVNAALTQDGSILNIYAAVIEQSVGEELKAELLSGRRASASIFTVKTDYSAFDGTSMATPHVAGVVALMKAANKSLTPAEVKQIITGTARPLSGSNSKNEWGAGLIDAEAAVTAALGR